MGILLELKRRNGIRVALFYGIASWLIIQVAETVLPLYAVPEGVLRGTQNNGARMLELRLPMD